MPEHPDTALEVVQALDVGARGAPGEDAFLDGLQLGFQRIDDREVAIDHRVHQGVQHEAGAVAQQLGLALAALAHPEKAL